MPVSQRLILDNNLDNNLDEKQGLQTTETETKSPDVDAQDANIKLIDASFNATMTDNNSEKKNNKSSHDQNEAATTLIRIRDGTDDSNANYHD